MSDMLLVDAILYLKNWDLSVWANLYSDMPSKQAKVKVADRKLSKRRRRMHESSFLSISETIPNAL